MVFLGYLLPALTSVFATVVSASNIQATLRNGLSARSSPPAYVANKISWDPGDDGDHPFCKWEGAGQVGRRPRLRTQSLRLLVPQPRVPDWLPPPQRHLVPGQPSVYSKRLQPHPDRQLWHLSDLGCSSEWAFRLVRCPQSRGNNTSLTDGPLLSVSILEITTKFSKNTTDLRPSYGKMQCPVLPDFGDKTPNSVVWVIGCPKAGVPVTNLPGMVTS